MFCMNCGTKLPDNAKFCYQCGEKTNVGVEQNPVTESNPSSPISDAEKKDVEKNSNVTAENNKQSSSNDMVVAQNENITDESESSEETVEADGMDFFVLGNKVHLTEEDLRLDILQSRFVELAYEKADKAYDEFVEKFEKENDLYSIRNLFVTIAGDNCVKAINLAFQKLIDSGIDTITKDRYHEMLSKKLANSSTVKSIHQGMLNIEKMKNQLAYEKEMNKANWVGGGFGLSGAISGAVKAKALNMAQDGLTSLGKAITGNSDSARLRRYAS